MIRVNGRRRAVTWLAATAALIAVVALAVVYHQWSSADEFDDGTWYRIVNRETGLALDVPTASSANGVELIQWPRDGGANQQFRFAASDNGNYRMIARHSGKAVGVREGSPTGGTEIVQWEDLDSVHQRFELWETEEGFLRIVSEHSGRALDMADWSVNPGAAVTETSLHPGWMQQWSLIPVADGADPNPVSSGLTGWAGENGGTTGGQGGEVVDVFSADQMEAAIVAEGPLTIRVNGTITWPDSHPIASDKTIVGVGEAWIGGGLEITDADNVIVQNLNFKDWADDAIDVGDATNVWIDHNSFYGGDSALDLESQSAYVTASWNYFTGRDELTMPADAPGGEIPQPRVSFHHNWFDATAPADELARFTAAVDASDNHYSAVEPADTEAASATSSDVEGAVMAGAGAGYT